VALEMSVKSFIIQAQQELSFHLCRVIMSQNHRYLREVECSKYISLQKIHINKTRVLVAGTNREGWLTRQAGWQAGWLNRYACYHRDKTRVQMPAKIFPHLKVKC
jgi:hypothetical protein